MYDRAVTDARIHEAEAEFDCAVIPHTLVEIEEWIDRLADVYDDEGTQVRKLTQDEHTFITNERRICALDAKYALTSYSHIRDWQGRITRFNPNIAQCMVFDIWAELERAGRAIMMMQLKARQLGVSTLTELEVARRTQFVPDVNAVVASASPAQSEKMAKMMETSWDEMPWWLMPTKTRDKAGSLIEFGHQNSAVSIQAGNQIAGIARGDTPDVVHLSEVSSYPDPEDLIDASLLRAIHESPWVFLILESTAIGRHNYWHHSWLFNKENWPLGKSRLCPIFLPWFVGRDIYPTETWLRSRPITPGWKPSTLTQQHADRAARYVHSNDLLKKYLGDTWTMPIEQQWFYEVEREEARAKKELNKFLSEMPSDDIEAFQSTNISVFDHETILVYHEAIKDPWGVFGIVGDQNEIPLRMHPDRRDIDHSLKPIALTCAWGTNVSRYDLIPLKFNGYSAFDPHGKLIVYEPPLDGFLHGIGVDTADGVGEDRTALEAIRKGDHEHNDAQCAEYVSPYVNAYNLWPISYAIATWYSTVILGERKQAKAVIECRGNGEHVQLEMRKRGWSNFHQWMRYDGKRMRLKDANKIGWFTNQWSRAAMLDLLMSYLNDGYFDASSPWFIEEMSDLERDDIRQSMKAVFGGHDDRIMAVGMVLFSLHVMEVRGNKRTERPDRYDDEQFVTYSPGFQGASTAQSADMSGYMGLVSRNSQRRQRLRG